MNYDSLDPVSFGESFDNHFYGICHEVDAVNGGITPLWKAYVRGDVACHFHLVINVRGVQAPCNLCADFQALIEPRGLDVSRGDALKRRSVKKDVASPNKDWIKHSVFVPVRESLENRKGVKRRNSREWRRAVHSIVGLRPLDICPVSRRDFAVGVRACDATAFLLDREFDQSAMFFDLGSSVVVEDKLPSEKVEGASQIVDDVSENHSYAKQPPIGHYCNPKDMISRIRIELGRKLDRIAFFPENGFDFGFQSIAMLPRPLNLGPDTAQVDSHSSPRGIE